MRNATSVRELKLVNIGRSRGIRLPRAMRLKYGWDDSLILEETEDGVLPRGAARRLSWEDTSRAMAAEGEDLARPRRGGRRRPGLMAVPGGGGSGDR